MRYVLTMLAAVALMAAGGCGDDDPSDEPTGAGAITQEEGRSPAEAPPAVLNAALTTMRQQGTSAADGLEGVSDVDLLPSEKGAELLIDRGAVDEDKFCAAHRTVTEAEATAEAKSAFDSAWKGGAPDELQDMGEAMYNALSTRCSMN